MFLTIFKSDVIFSGDGCWSWTDKLNWFFWVKTNKIQTLILAELLAIGLHRTQKQSFNGAFPEKWAKWTILVKEFFFSPADSLRPESSLETCS